MSSPRSSTTLGCQSPATLAQPMTWNLEPVRNQIANPGQLVAFLMRADTLHRLVHWIAKTGSSTVMANRSMIPNRSLRIFAPGIQRSATSTR